MSIQDNKVIFDGKLKRHKGLMWFLGGVEILLTIVLGLVVATTKLLSPSAESAPGIINKLSYQGRLTDTSGNALGGTGTNYCFRFSVYDAVSAGNKVWPSGTPATTTLSVISGVFNADVGSADTLDYDFYPTSTTYLNVEVYTVTSTCTGGSWETLAPRQQILATGYSIAAENVYGDLLRTDIASSIVQIGTGGGVSSSSVKKLALDIANTSQILGSSCSINGTIWYNSHASNTQALICEAGIIKAVTNQIMFPHYPYEALPLNSSANNSGTTGAGTNMSAIFFVSPMFLDHPVSFTRANLWVSNITVAGTGTASVNRYVGIYTLNGGTALSLLSSFMFRQEVTQNSVTAQSHRFYWGTNSTSNSSSSGGNISANYAGVRALPIWTGGTSLPAGKYYLVQGQNHVTAGSNIVSGYHNMYVSFSVSTAGQLGSAASLSPFPLLGAVSSTSTFGNLTSPFMPGSIHTSAITNTGGVSQWRSNYINLIGNYSQL